MAIFDRFQANQSSELKYPSLLGGNGPNSEERYGIFRTFKCTFGVSGFRGSVAGRGDCNPSIKKPRLHSGGHPGKFTLQFLMAFKIFSAQQLSLCVNSLDGGNSALVRGF